MFCKKSLAIHLFLCSVAIAFRDEAIKYEGQQVFQSLSSPSKTENGVLNFTLRHIFHHGTYLHPGLIRRKDILPNQPTWTQTEDLCKASPPYFLIHSTTTPMQRPKDLSPSSIDSLIGAARRAGHVLDLPPSAWAIEEVLAPNVTDKSTVLAFAHMAIDSYYVNDTCAGWEDPGGGFNSSDDFGWEGDGLRGHVFADESNSTIVITIKGTSRALWDGEGTTRNDKENDNLFGSCCCGQLSAPTSRRVCNCLRSVYKCNSECVTTALLQENRYYAASRHIYSNVSSLYPNANIWLTGHSLGGTVASLLGQTYFHPTITFEAVPDALAASRLGLPRPPAPAKPSPPPGTQTESSSTTSTTSTTSTKPQPHYHTPHTQPRRPPPPRGTQKTESSSSSGSSTTSTTSTKPQPHTHTPHTRPRPPSPFPPPPIYHIGHTADPIYTGTCNGLLSPCSLWGYAFETRCHSGRRCVYDVVADLKWRVDVRTHGLRTVIDEVIGAYEGVPVCVAEEGCVDCGGWEM